MCLCHFIHSEILLEFCIIYMVLIASKVVLLTNFIFLFITHYLTLTVVYP